MSCSRKARMLHAPAHLLRVRARARARARVGVGVGLRVRVRVRFMQRHAPR